ncbi:MAG TPA: hypothetical protein VEJ87_10725, partial [Acidimicrobiales bacterium]|nr:hypothetical protein [Acidimicrobiales bacterium]
TLWAWKGLATSPSSCWCVRWQRTYYNTTSNGTEGSGDPRKLPGPDRVIESRKEYLSTPWPRATAGVLLAYGSDTTTGSFAMEALDTTGGRGGNLSFDTVIYVPPGDHERISVSGAAELDTEKLRPDGSALVYVAPDPLTGPDRPALPYTVTIGNAASDGTLARVTALARNPLPPIPEPAARAILEQALSVAEVSTDPKVRSGAQLAAPLAGILLPTPDPNG